MVVYEVNLVVDAAIVGDYERWMAAHIKEMLQIPGFFRARWYGRNPQDEGDAPSSDTHWTIQYDVYTRDDLNRYFREDAARMRGDGVARFGDGFRASRRILVPRSLEATPA
ncbi:MAG: DUF4286 domain-containing protein [Deltaproteobacteria bacterium HGW-Deltaproteobacteria-14]|jgi:hypothetical protein|nr:MAG: DUF4286 domain-containing protein [Deltaproteobacteria bacterium HGW-Deltaproteobacteria-14]